MKEAIPAFRAIQRRTNTAVITISVLGALVTFLYFNVIAPLPEGQASLRTVGWLEVVVLLLFVGIPLGLGFAWTNRRDVRIAAWHERLRRGTSAAEVPVKVRQDVLNVPLRAAAWNACMWVLVGTVVSLLNGTFRFFVGFVGVGGLLTTVMLFFVVDVLWRPVIPPFFPEGKLSAIGAFRLPVLGRLLVVFLLIGILPPAILVNLSWQRAQTLLAAPNPQAVLSNLLILQVFILATSILASVALAVFMTRSITGPLDALQRAMKRVEQSDFDVRVPVTSDDELGYLSERLNEMAEGLKERELIKEAHRKVEQELAIAWTIQESFLPKEVPQVPGWQLTATLKPAKQTSGDFYDFIPLPNGRMGILVADVADKGTGAALYMALSRTLIRTYAIEHGTQPALALGAANRRILMDTQAGLFVTVFYGILDAVSGTLTYCNAGHNPPYLFSAKGDRAVQALGTTGIPLGIFEDWMWGQETAQLAPGDVLVLYSDGITEAQNAQEALFDTGRLLEVLQAKLGHPAQDVQDAVLAEVHSFVGDAPQFDDMTLMVVVRDLAEAQTGD